MIALLLLSLVTGSLYYSANSQLSAKDQEILRLRSAALNGNLTILRQELTLLQLNSTISSLGGSLTRYQNESAYLRLELSVAEQVGGFTVVVYFANETVGTDPGTSVEVTTQANGHNGTLALLPQSGCPISGGDLQSTGARNTLYVWLDSSAPAAQSAYYSLNGLPFSVYLQNRGTAAVACRVSLLYVQH